MKLRFRLGAVLLLTLSLLFGSVSFAAAQDATPGAATPIATSTVEPTATTAAGEPTTAAGEPTKAAVVALPNTGQGSSSNGSTLILLFGAMSLVTVAAGFAWRQRRNA